VWLGDEDMSRRKPARAGADRLCLWRLCGGPACLRAKACRGDPQACLGLMRGWLKALAAAAHAAPAFEAEPLRKVLSPDEARLLGLWRRAVEEAELKPRAPEDEADIERLRMELYHRLVALSQQDEEEDSAP
jgi:hypothetical protein